MSWTDERVALLEKLWGEGRTAAEIAKELGDVTRNAVIGKAHRLKLSNRVSPIQQNSKKAAVKLPVEKAKVAGMIRPAVKTPLSSGTEGVTMAELTPRMCRWPMGDPKNPDFRFCGCTAAPGLSYCDEHAKMAYQTSGRTRPLREDDFDGVDKDVKKVSVA
ncbi:MAG: gcrA cell cycle regulator family protein [Alphaproteobacteria bacterium]|nr:gcrA cell cycle regulator family protein [Alphaproteobacteria bacterium]